MKRMLRTPEKRRRVEEIMGTLFRSEAKARIYLFLAVRGGALSSEIEKGTCLHPSTVREALSEMVGDGHIKRVRVEKEAKGAGRSPYRYSAAPISGIIKMHVEELERQFGAALAGMAGKAAGRRNHA